MSRVAAKIATGKEKGEERIGKDGEGPVDMLAGGSREQNSLAIEENA